MTPSEIAALKARVQHEIEQLAPLLIATSDWMYANPELGYQEHQAAERLTALLEEFGAQVTRGVADLPTAFTAELLPQRDGPRLAIVAEYDALPDVGHGCGHNIIATAAIGAGMALARLGASLPGRAVVVGTPAEESAVPDAGGKIPLLDHGIFDDLSAAIMVHPNNYDGIASRPSLVAHGLEFVFHGQAAHAAANPHEGRNALDAMIATFSSIGLLRQQVRGDARIHGVITYGGGAPNVIPPLTRARFRVRAADPAYAKALVERVVACGQAGALATGCRLEWREDTRPYLNMVPSHVLGDALARNLATTGRTPQPEPRSDGAGSTDFGNVSHRVPSAYALLKICGPEAGWHTRAVADATVTPLGHSAIVAGAASLALTAIDILTDPALRQQAATEHELALATMAH